MTPRFSRRTAIKATGSLGVGFATGGLLASNAAASREFAQELKTTRLTTKKYRSLKTAEANGYLFNVILDFVGVVFTNDANLGNKDPAEDPKHLFYAPVSGADIEGEDDVSDTNTVLAGVEYQLAGRPEDPNEDMYSDEDSSRNLKVSEADGWHNNPFGGNFHGLHVWAHLANPNGLFAVEHATIKDRLSD